MLNAQIIVAPGDEVNSSRGLLFSLRPFSFQYVLQLPLITAQKVYDAANYECHPHKRHTNRSPVNYAIVIPTINRIYERKSNKRMDYCVILGASGFHAVLLRLLERDVVKVNRLIANILYNNILFFGFAG